MIKIQDLIGCARKLTVIKDSGQRSGSSILWLCRYDCGNEIYVYSSSLLRGLPKSCGCWNREQGEKMHEHMHYQDGTCLERLTRVSTDKLENRAGFRRLSLTKTGKYRVLITFQKQHYTLGYYKTFDEAVRVRLDAEQFLHTGYINAFKKYQDKTEADPAWAEENPFYYRVARQGREFQASTNGE